MSKPIIQLVSISKRVPVSEVYKCLECSALMERPARAVCGDDYLDMCPECRNVESFTTVFVDDNDNEYDDNDVETKGE